MNKNNHQDEVEKFPEELLIPFVNQEETIDTILSAYAPQYHLVDAPTGYGKTKLLRELESRFQEKFWCAYLCADEHQTLRKLIRAMFKKFNLTEPLSDEKLLELLISALGSQLKQKRQEDDTKEGLVLLIDLGNLEQEAALTLINGLLKFFIPRLQLNLTFDEFFRAKSNTFRVVIAGRHLAGLDDVKSSSLPLRIHKLSLFSYNIVLSLVQSVLIPSGVQEPIKSEDEISHLAAHLTYLSGGHPSSLAALLKEYKAKAVSPDEFLEHYRLDIQAITTQKIGQVRDDIPPELQGVMDVLSPCRRFNPKFLRKIMNNNLLESADEYNLVDGLTNAYLVTRKDGFFQDNITRRLLAIRLRQERADYFIKICQAARDIYADYLPQSTTNRPEMIALELLYQELQLGYYELKADTLEESDLEKREKLAEKFFDILDNHLHILISGRHKGDMMAKFTEALEKDIEFQFALNYFLRAEFYDEQPYHDLKKHLQGDKHG